MELPVTAQAVQFGLSALLGVGLGLVYDLLRALRRHAKKLTALLDAVFCLTVLCALLLLALYVGHGQLRVFMIPGVALGATAYFLTLSRLAVKLFEGFWRLLVLPWRLLFRLGKKIFGFFQKIAKKGVAFAKKSFNIKEKKRHGREEYPSAAKRRRKNRPKFRRRRRRPG